MNVADFHFRLPPELIAQRPARRRLERRRGATPHRRFDELPALLRSGDLLVLNDTRVLPARLVGRKPSGGRVEILLVETVEQEPRRGVWRALLRASRKPAAGSAVEFGPHLSGQILSREGSSWLVMLCCTRGQLAGHLEREGRPPLPPYIRRGPAGADAADRERYQTVRAGAIAAPTAGLHFTTKLLAELTRRGIEQTTLTLHVGAGTFLPVTVEHVEQHRMHEERLELPAPAARAIRDTLPAASSSILATASVSWTP
jgi:S-adenosylmethionine:tRNA ribosyltransferase-isomerase